ncbi:PDR/VanB family oxidoreductase [Arenibacter echinorum]|uniref:Vanillate O-demethylase ferredoxin subunit n=1 Tax=Arenibacter echinorum TaxID=440515 RepID=A0A327RK19_9FLAO|nr:PDR/VanB family oxidoreductase [Arenibacter echinorum]RAJ15904.1 vanillate O-demethylase ferredoxin subunit [Arenibacter echinorum]
MRYRNSWEDAVVSKMKKVADNVMQIQITPVGSTEVFTVGSHLDISVLINDLPEIRSYSLVGRYSPNSPYTIAVKRLPASRGGSKYMWGLKEGSKLRISQPTNHFELSFNTPDYLLIAGGIGITPILGMAEELMAQNDKNVRMLYLGRSEKEMPYINLSKKLLGQNLIVHFSDVDGFFDTSKIIDLSNTETQIYLCGPIGLMNAIRKTWENSPFANQNLRYETFGASGLFAPQAFTVKIPRFNKELKVKENQTMLKALEEAQIAVMYDCKKGECGLCQVDILEVSGDVDHRDFFFSEAEKGENKKMCACVSRIANGDVVIDTAYRGT